MILLLIFIVICIVCYSISKKIEANNQPSAEMKAAALNMHIENILLSGGNFSLISFNFALMHRCVSASAYASTLTDRDKLYAAGLCNAYQYLASGELDPIDINVAVDFAKKGIICLGGESLSHGFHSYGDSALIVNFAMQLQALYFSVDTNLLHHDIVEQVVQNKKKSIQAVDLAGDISPLSDQYRTVNEFVNASLSDDSFLLLLRNFDQISIDL